MTYTPPDTRSASNNITLNIQRSSPHSTSVPINSTNPPRSDTSLPKQTFNPDGTRKYLNIRPAGGQPFPLKKGKRYLAEDYKNGVEVKKEKGATPSAKEWKAKIEKAAGPESGVKDEERVVKREDVSVFREHSSQNSDSSPERPLIEVLRSMRREGAIAEVSTSGGAAEKSEDDRGRKTVRGVEKRHGGTRGGK